METKNNNTLIISIATLTLGLVMGYLLGTSRGVYHPMMTGSTNFSNYYPMNHHQGMRNHMGNLTINRDTASGAEFEEGFINEMIIHHARAISLAEVLLQKTQRPELIKLGNDIITTGTNEIQMMKTWRQTWYNN